MRRLVNIGTIKAEPGFTFLPGGTVTFREMHCHTVIHRYLKETGRELKKTSMKEW